MNETEYLYRGVDNQPIPPVFHPEVYKTKNGTPYLKDPGVVLIGLTLVDLRDVQPFLDGFDSELEYNQYLQDPVKISTPESLVKFAGQLCYMSFGPKRTWNQDTSKYLRHIKESGHGSVLEHINLSFLFYGISRSLTHELVRHRAGMGFCLAGNTEVWSGSKQKGKWDGVRKSWPIEQLYDWSIDPKRKGRLKLITVRCFDGEKFVSARVKKVSCSGINHVYRILLEDGKFIKCSREHRFLTKTGWACLSDMLTIGTEIATNGRPIGYTHSESARAKMSLAATGKNNSQWKGDNASKSAGNLRAWKLFKTEPCEKCGDPKGQRHHKDRNTLNNARQNIQFLCATCHTKQHYVEDGSSKVLTVKWLKIIDIVYVGETMTYDIEVDHQAHNFVANGFVTHNSQLSQRYVDGKSLRFVERPEYQSDNVLHAMFERRIDINAAEYAATADWLMELQTKGNPTLSAEHKTDLRKRVNQCARSVLPNETEAPIVVTMNGRALRHVLEMRTAQGAEIEIRKLFDRVYDIAHKVVPYLVEDYSAQALPDGTTVIDTKFRKV